MARLLTKVWRRGRNPLAGLCLAGALAGCAGNDFMPLPPGGFLDEGSYRWEAETADVPEAREKTATSKAETKADRQQAARAAAAEKKAAADEKARLRAEEKEAAAAKKKAAADEKALRRAAKAEAAAAGKAAIPPPVQEPAEGRPESAPAAAAVPGAAYVLQAGDEIDIQVYREPELSGTFKLNAAGEIRHSLVGPVPLAGLTVEAAEADFTQRLAKDYLVNPRVIVKLAATQSSQIVVLGEVEKPGVYPLPFGEEMTLLQAIAGAGGFTELASPDRVSLVRRRPDGGQTTLKIRVSDLLGGKGKQPDVPLEPNDVVMVPEVFF